MELGEKINKFIRKFFKKEEKKERTTKNIFVLVLDPKEGPQLMKTSSDEALDPTMVIEIIYRIINPNDKEQIYSLTCADDLIPSYSNLEIYYSSSDNPDEQSKILSWFAGYPLNSDRDAYIIVQKDFLDGTNIELSYKKFEEEVYRFYNEILRKMYLSKYGIAKISLWALNDSPLYVDLDKIDSFYDEILSESFQPGSRSQGWNIICQSGDSCKTDLYKKNHILMSMSDRREIEIYFTPEEANKRSVN